MTLILQYFLFGLIFSFVVGLIFYERNRLRLETQRSAENILRIEDIKKMITALYGDFKSADGKIEGIHKRIDALFTVDAPSPNDPSLLKNDSEQFNEESLSIPDNVKIAIEGGEDAHIPPGYEEAKKV